jgi:hypothetical protein
MQEIKLTPAEIKLIELKREENRLIEEKKKAEEEIARGRDIVNAEQDIEKTIKVTSTKNKMLGDAFNEIELKYPGKFKLHVSTKEICKNVTKSGYDAERNYIGQTIVWSKSVPTPVYEIQLASDPFLRITVEEHIVYSGSYITRASNKGFKFHIEGLYEYDGKYYVKATTAAEKLVEVENKKAREAAKKDLVKYTLNVSKATLTKKFPTAQITVANEYVSPRTVNPYAKRGQEGWYEIVATVRFTNGFGYSFKISPNSSNPDEPNFSKGKVIIQPNELTAMDMLVALEGLEKLGSK